MLLARVRVLAFVALVGTLFASLGMAQFVEAYPRVIPFEATAHALLSAEQPPTHFFGIVPEQVGVDSAPFQVSIRLVDLPTGAATNFVIVPTPLPGSIPGTKAAAGLVRF
jgi:hypothetical protein